MKITFSKGQEVVFWAKVKGRTHARINAIALQDGETGTARKFLLSVTDKEEREHHVKVAGNRIYEVHS